MAMVDDYMVLRPVLLQIPSKKSVRASPPFLFAGLLLMGYDRLGACHPACRNNQIGDITSSWDLW